MIRTTAVLCRNWSRFGQLTRLSSPWTSRANLRGLAANPCLCCVFLAPAPLAGPRPLPIFSSPDLIRRSRAGGTRTPDRRFWRPLLYQLSYCPLTPNGSPGAPYAAGTTDRISATGYDPGCCAGSYGCGSSGACTPRKPALLIVAQLSSRSQGRDQYVPPPLLNVQLLQDLGDHTGSYRPATFPYCEVQPLIHGDRRDQLYLHHRVVPRHHHLYALF